MIKHRLFISFIIVLLITVASTLMYNKAININIPLTPVDSNVDIILSDSTKETIYFGVISRFSPQILYKGYQPVIDYLSSETPFHFELKLSSSYDECVLQLAKGDVDMAFLGSFIYLKSRDTHNLKCILKPLNERGDPFFHSILITLDTNPIYTINDLKGKKIALPSQNSYSGNWLLKELSNRGLYPSKSIHIHHFPYHHLVIHQVLKGDYDAGVVKDRVLREYESTELRTVALSEPVPGSPIVVRKNTDPVFIRIISDALLKIDPANPFYKELISDWDEEFRYGFAVARDKDYDVLKYLLIKDLTDDDQ